MTDEIVYTVFHEDGPIRLTETELCNGYMELRAALAAAEALAERYAKALEEIRRWEPGSETWKIARAALADEGQG